MTCFKNIIYKKIYNTDLFTQNIFFSSLYKDTYGQKTDTGRQKETKNNFRTADKRI